MYLYLFKFLKQINYKIILNTKLVSKINDKKNLFFKKKYNPKTLVSRRLSFILRKRKKLKNYKNKKVDKGNFFFKKFFYKILLKNRKSLRRFFFFNSKTRQRKLTKHIFLNQKCGVVGNNAYEFSLFNVLLRSHFCLSISDTLSLIKNKFVFLNGALITQHNYLTLEHDFIQLKITKHIYKYIQFSKNFLKKKLSIFRLNSWKFFKQKFFKQQQQLKPQKRKTPKYLFLFFLFKLDVPKYFEVDYFTLCICLLKRQQSNISTTYYLNKFFSYKLFQLYNFKKLN